MNKKIFTAVVLAAGSGSRMKSDIPKQYMMLGEYPVIYYSLMAFEKSAADAVVLVTGEDDIPFCENEIIKKYGLKKVEAVVAGGSERFLSVYEGLKAAEGTDYVLIHDGARPLLSVDMIERSMKAVEEEKACIPAIAVKDTIKISNSDGYVEDTPDRSRLCAVQTPQSFEYGLLMNAYTSFFAAHQDGKTDVSVTDDAMLVENFGSRKVKLIEGDLHNIKITTPEDLLLAELFIKRFQKRKKAVDTVG